MLTRFKKGDLISAKGMPDSLAIIIFIAKSKMKMKFQITIQWLDFYGDDMLIAHFTKKKLLANYVIVSSILRDPEDV